MEPVTLILTALAAGAAKGAGESASAAVKDAYNGLKRLVSSRFAGKPSAEIALVEHENDPETWEAPLAKELRTSHADTDNRVIIAAQQLLKLLDEAGTQAGKYTVDVRGAQGIQIGDHGTQTVHFNTPAPDPTNRDG
ncbi:hypothetical protein [Kribbella sp. NPDC051620]|uniref:hypothetical protein n=1 Tax=Kribbella sp. NPDC051620 TaxID=3364120 RepID=UPI0037ACC5CD